MKLEQADLERVRRRLARRVHGTPVIESRLVSAAAGCTLLLKGEHLQRAGSFKVRGVFNTLLQLDDATRARGVVTGSSGNHGQALALAAGELGMHATIVVPEDITAVKETAIRGYGARIERRGRSPAERLERARELAAAPGGPIMIPPFDDRRVIAGQATVAAELLEQDGAIETLAVPVGGGGLLAGCALAVKLMAPRVRVVGVETQNADDACRSFRSGRRVVIDPPETIADGMRHRELGELTWEVIREHADDMVVVTDGEVIETMELLWTRAKVVAEPTGAVAAAAVLAGRVRGGRVAAVVSGGNVEPDFLARLRSRDGAPG